jgi:hypothetical protein
MDRSANCCLCGTPRRPTQAPVASFGNGERLISIAEHRPLQPGRWEHSGGQLVASVSLWRNGGSDPGRTHICDECVLVGLRHVKAFVDGSIAALAPPAATLKDKEA